jgi:hypothetical protein
MVPGLLTQTDTNPVTSTGAESTTIGARLLSHSVRTMPTRVGGSSMT